MNNWVAANGVAKSDADVYEKLWIMTLTRLGSNTALESAA